MTEIVEVKAATYPVWNRYILLGALRIAGLKLGWVRVLAIANVDAAHFPNTLRQVRP